MAIETPPNAITSAVTATSTADSSTPGAGATHLQPPPDLGASNHQGHSSDNARSFQATSRVARSIYGLLLVLTVLEALELHPPHESWAAPELLIGTILTVALFEFYADAIAEIFLQDRHFSQAELRQIGLESVPILIGLPIPLAMLALTALGVVGIVRSIDAAQILAYSSFLIYIAWLARKKDVNRTTRLIAGISLFVVAFVLVGLKAGFH